MSYGVDKSELGKKLSTQVHCGHLSIKFYENGIEVKPYTQERVRLSMQEAEMLLQTLLRWRNRKKMLEDI